MTKKRHEQGYESRTSTIWTSSLKLILHTRLQETDHLIPQRPTSMVSEARSTNPTLHSLPLGDNTLVLTGADVLQRPLEMTLRPIKTGIRFVICCVQVRMDELD